jgi:hypothetical protein
MKKGSASENSHGATSAMFSLWDAEPSAFRSGCQKLQQRLRELGLTLDV